MNTAIESALIVPVPDAEPAVADWRMKLDPAAGWGVPAHITIIYPFAPPELIDAATVDELARLFARHTAFDFTLAGPHWFGSETMWLSPKPDRPFLDLIDAVVDRWPQYPPYEGRHETVVPHLTVGDGAELAEMTEASTAISPQLPIATTASEAWLMTGGPLPGAWDTEMVFSLST